MDMKR